MGLGEGGVEVVAGLCDKGEGGGCGEGAVPIED